MGPSKAFGNRFSGLDFVPCPQWQKKAPASVKAGALYLNCVDVALLRITAGRGRLFVLHRRQQFFLGLCRVLQ